MKLVEEEVRKSSRSKKWDTSFPDDLRKELKKSGFYKKELVGSLSEKMKRIPPNLEYLVGNFQIPGIDFCLPVASTTPQIVKDRSKKIVQFLKERNQEDLAILSLIGVSGIGNLDPS
jgi:hypothetical protein